MLNTAPTTMAKGMRRILALSTAGLLLTALLVGCTSSTTAPAQGNAAPQEKAAPAAPPIKVKMAQSIDDLSYLTIYVARANDYFKAEGIEIDVTVIQGGGGPEMAALLTGDVEFAATNPARLISTVKQGRKVVGIQNILGKSIVQIVMGKEAAAKLKITAANSLEEKVKAWKGLNVGVSRAGSLTHRYALFLMQKYGLTEKDAEVVAVGGGSTAVAAIVEKKVDVLVMSSPTPEELVYGRKDAMLLIDSAGGEIPEFRDYLQQLLVVQTDWATKNKETVRKVVRALNKANAFVVDNTPEKSVELIKQFYPTISSEVLLEAVRTIRKGVAKDGSFSEAGVVANFLLEPDGAELQKTLKWTDLVTNDYLK